MHYIYKDMQIIFKEVLNMSIKRFIILITILTLTFSLASCGTKIVSPDSTIKPPEVTQSNNVKIMNEYRDLMNKSSSPSVILTFIEANIGNLSKEEADTVVTGLIDIQKKQLQNYQDKLYSEEINSKVNAYKQEDLISLKNIKEENIKVLFENAFKDGYKLFSAEGMYDFELDYESLKNKLSGFVSESVASYLDIMSNESKSHFAADGAIRISLDELADRVINTEKFIEKYSDSQFIQEIKLRYNWYLTAYLIGLNNTPAFSYEDNTLRPEVLTNFKNTMIKYKDSKLAGTLKDYIDLIEKNKSQKTKEVLDFVTKVTANS